MRLKRVCILSFAAAAIALWLLPRAALAQSTLNFLPLLTNGDAPLCRFGVNGAPRSYPIEPLRIGWYVDYQATQNPNAPGSMHYYPMIRLEQIGEDGYAYSVFGSREPTSLAQLYAVIDNNPSTYWFIGNEPDRLQFQDDMEPRAYARAYHDLYYLIKERDPSAKIVAGSIVQPTPLRLEYLDQVLLNYFELYREKMPVDAWAFHNFILNEASCSYYAQFYPNDPNGLLNACWGADIPPGIDAVDGMRVDVQQNTDLETFKEQVVAFRTWMAERGYRNVPAFLSEYGVLMPEGIFTPDFDEARVNQYMNATFDYLLEEAIDPEIGYPGDNNRLVQRFSWYSVDDNIDHNGFLFDRTQPAAISRTGMGDNFYNYTSQVQRQVDFYPANVQVIGGPPLTAQGTTSITLQAEIHNSGNLGVTSRATVRFFNGDPAAGGKQIGDPQTIQLMGCGEAAQVRTAWEDVAPGQYEVYVQVSSGETEVDTTNNVISTTVAFSDTRLNLPALAEPVAPQATFRD